MERIPSLIWLDSPTTETLSDAFLEEVSKAVPGVDKNLAADLARRTAGDLIVGLSKQKKEVVRRLTARAIRDDWSTDTLADRIKAQVGLDVRSSNAVENFRQALLNKGVARGAARTQANDYAKRLRLSRATTIARTELGRLVAVTKRAQWDDWKAQGVIDQYAVRVWHVTNPKPCNVCRPMNGARAAINKGYKNGHHGPPLHPNCGCFETLEKGPNVLMKAEPRDADRDGWVNEGTPQKRLARQRQRVRPKSPFAPEKPSPEGMAPATPEQRKNGIANPGGKPIRIPPAWTNVTVAISPDGKNGKMVQGYDKAGRRQSIYSGEHHAKQAIIKWARIKALQPHLEDLDEAIEVGVLNDQPHAVALALIRIQGLRPGSATDTKAKVQAYGATTLQSRHVTVDGNDVSLDFIAKEGIHQKFTINDSALASAIKKLKENKEPGDSLFGPSASTQSETLLKTVAGDEFKIKDLRTVKANVVAYQVVQSMRAPTTEAEFKAARLQVAELVSAQLGNKPKQALDSYINPAVFAVWQLGLT